MMEAKYAEIRELDNRGTFRAVPGAELQDGESLITVKCVLAIKSDEGKEEWCKERYVADGHVDIMKDYLIHGAQNV